MTLATAQERAAALPSQERREPLLERANGATRGVVERVVSTRYGALALAAVVLLLAALLFVARVSHHGSAPPPRPTVSEAQLQRQEMQIVQLREELHSARRTARATRQKLQVSERELEASPRARVGRRQAASGKHGRHEGGR